MSDERSPSAAPDDESAADDLDAAGPSDSSDDSEPGGGPQRVVSEQSVDDILNSLDATKSESASSNDATQPASEPTETSDAVTAEFDGDDGLDADDVETTTADTDRAAATDDPAENDSPSADAPSVNASASSPPEDPADASLEDLAARVEDGTVTGADVRAAEAGEGRDSTPEIDDVDLSMDDLETGESGTSATDDDWPDDAGPLAGSIDGDTGGSDGGEPKDDGPGLFGRIKRLFSR
ncbi:hypothetical protein [Natrinema sp. 74]|uniref:hypothetical protein n=1 Tax=Natrinema sp. 74 TaxID=3384159 RepID=UPI0038D39C99